MDYIVRLTFSATSVHIGAYPLCMCVVWYNYNIQLDFSVGVAGRGLYIYRGWPSWGWGDLHVWQ